ncbi:MAG: type II secretion system protein GspM [Steroidobacteraceae bacterium]
MSWRARYDALQPRERMMVTGGACLAALLLLIALLLPLGSKVHKGRDRLASKGADLGWMEQVVPRLAGAGARVTAPANRDNMVVIVDRTAREVGLGSALASSEPAGEGALRVRLAAAPFDQMVAWLARLAQQNGVQVVSASVEATGESGVVNAQLQLQAP